MKKTKRVAILIPSRGNLDLLDSACRALAENTKYKNYYVLVAFDGVRAAYSRFAADDYGIEIKKTRTAKRAGYIATLNYAYAKAEADLFVPWSDDTRPSPGWLKMAVDQYSAAFPKGGGLMSMNDGYWGDRLATQSIFDRKFVRVCGYPEGCIRFPGYILSGVDNEVTAMAKIAGLFVYAGGIRIYHPTPLEKTSDAKNKAHDRALWQERRGLFE